MAEVKIIDKGLYKDITLLLHEIGMPAHIVGHDYLRTAIEIAFFDETYLNNVMFKLYPDLAIIYHTSIAGVERGMRVAIKIAWLRASRSTLYSVFGNSIDLMRDKPGTKEFISIVVKKLKVRNL